MIVFRTDKLEALEVLPKDSLVESRYQTVKDQIHFMASKLLYDSDNTFFGVVFEGRQMVGFIFAFLVNNRKYCFIEHCYMLPKVKLAYTKKLMFMLEEFCRNRNCTVLKMNTTRNPIAFNRKWGFEVDSYVMYKSIGD